jgi:ATP-dependent Clp protease ATP-binding subunit ClpA
MKRTIARLIEAPLADRLLAGTLSKTQRLLVDVADGKLSFDVESQSVRH